MAGRAISLDFDLDESSGTDVSQHANAIEVPDFERMVYVHRKAIASDKYKAILCPAPDEIQVRSSLHKTK